jgi:hypothetical protein
VALADNFDSLPLLHTDFRKSLPAHPCDASARVVRSGICDLKADSLAIICHCFLSHAQAIGHAVAAAGKELDDPDLPGATRREPRRLFQAAKLLGKRHMDGFVAGGGLWPVGVSALVCRD